MNIPPGRRRSAARWLGAPGAGLLAILGGCRAYEAQPLDLAAHDASLRGRTADAAPPARFLERLRAADADADAPEALAFDDGLTLAEGEVVALLYNADLRRARLAAGVTRADAATAGLWDDPVLGFDGAELLSPSGPFEYGLTLALTLPVSGRLDAERARAGLAHETELRRIVDAEWSARAAVRRAWAAWSAAELRVQLLRDTKGRVERVVGITDRLVGAGELARTEGRLVSVELAERRAAIEEAALDTTRARLALLGTMGLAPDAAVDLVPAFPHPAPPADPSIAARLVRCSTELSAHRARYATAEAALRREIRAQYPDLTLGAGYGDEDGDRLLLGASVRVPLWNRNRDGIAIAEAERDLARGAAETAYERLLREAALASATLDAAAAQRAQYETRVVPLLAEQSAEIERVADLGEVDTLLLLETVRGLHDAQARLIDLRRAEAEAAVELVRLLGPDHAGHPAPVDDVPTGGDR